MGPTRVTWVAGWQCPQSLVSTQNMSPLPSTYRPSPNASQASGSPIIYSFSSLSDSPPSVACLTFHFCQTALLSGHHVCLVVALLHATPHSWSPFLLSAATPGFRAAGSHTSHRKQPRPPEQRPPFLLKTYNLLSSSHWSWECENWPNPL